MQSRLREILDTWFRRHRSWPAEARQQRDQVISELRRVLAGACVKALEPDLVILDEFQRFKKLLARGGKIIALSGLSSIDLRRCQKIVSHAVPHTVGSAPHAPSPARIGALPPARLELAPSAPGRSRSASSSAVPIAPPPPPSTTSRRAQLRVRGRVRDTDTDPRRPPDQRLDSTPTDAGTCWNR